MEHKEIERKFLIRSSYEITKTPIEELEIMENYLAVNKEEEVRIRSMIDINEDNKYSHHLDIKAGEGLIRDEFKKLISKETFYSLMKNIKAKPIIKNRYLYEYKDYIIEIDVYLNKELKDLRIIEVEFKSLEDANSFILPKWLFNLSVVEVTYNKDYKNANLWKKINNLK